MRYRVDELAAEANCSVDTIRFYQKRDLLPPPLREGRVAWYEPDHLTRLRRIRRLAAAGFTLDQIRTLDDGADPVLDVLTRLAGTETASLSRSDLAAASGVSDEVVDLVVDSGLITAAGRDPERFTPDVVDMLRAGGALLAAGIDAEALAHLALRHAGHVTELSREAVGLFRRSLGGDRDAVAADVERLVPLAVSLVAHHFNASLLREALGQATGGDSPGSAAR